MSAAAVRFEDVHLGYEPRPHQLTVEGLLELHRFVVAVMHRRAGKTTGAQWWLIDGTERVRLQAPRMAYIAPTFRQAKQIAWDGDHGFKRILEPLRNVVEFNESELRIDFAGGARIQLGGAENLDAWRGTYWDRVVLDEVAQMDPRFWPEVIRPALSDRQGRALFIGTPAGEDAFHDLYKRAASNVDPDWAACIFPWQKTGVLPPHEIESARRDMSPEQFAREYECFPPGTMIATTRGNRPIEDIRLGDAVLTHKGRWRPVRRTMRKPFSGALCTIDAHGLTTPLRVTPEHPMAVYDKTSRRKSWKPAREVVAGDLLVLPRPARKAASPVVSQALAKLIAWYICEGSVNGNAVTFSCNYSSPSELERVRLIAKDAGYQAVQYGNDGRVIINSAELADRLSSWGGSLAENKRIPFDLIAGHEAEFWQELMLGDGCDTETQQGGRLWVYTTISRSLAFDVQLLAAMLGYRGTVCARPGGPQQFPGGRTCIAAESYAVRIPHGRKVNHSKLRAGFPVANGIAWRVRSVLTEPYEGDVFNLSVAEDESYVADGRAVHNCSFAAGIEGAYYARAMDEALAQGRITTVRVDPRFPVVTGWDLGWGDATVIWCAQSIGGEVRILRCIEDRGKKLADYHEMLVATRLNITQDFLPHDAAAHELIAGKSREETLRSLGRPIQVLPAVRKDDQIEAVRNLLPRCVFDAEGCADGIRHLRHYRVRPVSRGMLRTEGREPLHDEHSHAADAFAQLAVGLQEAPLVKRVQRKPSTKWVV